MGMAVRVESMRRATEAAIGHAAIFSEPTVGAVLYKALSAAIASRHKPHRYGAGGRATHHGQNHTT
jgi:hypothetical protein